MEKFRFYYPIEVRYGDLDPQGHVNNARYLTYIEQARIHYLLHLGLYQETTSFLDIGIIIATAQVVYKKPIHFGQNVLTGVAINRIGHKSMTMIYGLFDEANRDLMAEAETTLVAFDYRTQRTMPVPDAWRKKIQAFEKIT